MDKNEKSKEFNGKSEFKRGIRRNNLDFCSGWGHAGGAPSPRQSCTKTGISARPGLTRLSFWAQQERGVNAGISWAWAEGKAQLS